MPSVDELLLNGIDTLDDAEAFEETNKYCEIDETGRVIVLNDLAEILGVENDKAVERVYFRCPRYVGDNVDLDLKQCTVYINFQNANMDKDQYIVTDLNIDETDSTKVTFSWLLSKKVTQYKGVVNFIVCARKVATGGTIEQEWNTTLARATVLEGLEPDPYVVPSDDLDVVNQLMDLVKQEIEQVGQDTIDSIPDDYTELSDRVEMSIDNIKALNCYNLLFDLELPELAMSNGVEFRRLSDGSYSVVGNASGDALCNFFIKSGNMGLPDTLKKGVQYRLVYFSEKVDFILWEYSSGTYITGIETKEDRNFIIDERADGILIRLRVPNGEEVNEVVKPIIRSDDVLSNKELTEKTNDYYQFGAVEVEGNPILVKNTSGNAEIQFINLTESDDDTTVTVCGKNIYRTDSDMTQWSNNNVTYDFLENSKIKVASNGATESGVSSGNGLPEEYKTLNGKEWWHNFKFRFAKDTLVAISSNASEPQYYNSKVQMMVSDGTTNFYVMDSGLILSAKAGVEYGIRIVVLAGWSGEITYKPQIEIGNCVTEYTKYNGTRYFYNNVVVAPFSQENITTIFSNNSATINAKLYLMGNSESVEFSKKGVDNFNILTSYRNSKKRMPIVSFIDDDTSSIELVTRYYNLFSQHNVVGNYAVMTKRLDDISGLSNLLLSYEEKGYGCLYHCYYQSGDETRYWESGNEMYNEDLIKENFIKGLRSMDKYGFSNYKYWVTPYGVDDEFIQSLAKTHGMKCLFTMSGDFINNAFVTRNGNTNRFDIPRISVSSQSNQDRTKAIIDSLSKTDGWLIIVTHANSWGETTEVDNKVSEIIEYIISKNIKIESVPQAFREMETSFFLYDLFN